MNCTKIEEIRESFASRLVGAPFTPAQVVALCDAILELQKHANGPEIKALLEKLEASTDQTEKKKIRATLRALGHRGGLRGVDEDE